MWLKLQPGFTDLKGQRPEDSICCSGAGSEWTEFWVRMDRVLSVNGRVLSLNRSCCES